MPLIISLQPDVEARFREEAERDGITLEQFTTRRITEAELLWRIHTAVPESETRLLRRLLRKKSKGVLTQQEELDLQYILDQREERGAQRLRDLILLSQLRATPVRQIMEQLGIRPTVQ